MEFAGKVVVLTGAGAGIGRGIANAFAEHRAKVVGLEVNPETLFQTAKQISEKGGCFHPICADVTSEQSVEKAFDEITHTYDSIDILINNAGVEFYKDFIDIEVQEWDRQIAVNLKSVYLCCRHVVPVMIRAGRGCIINTASVQAFATTGQTAPYAAAKAGVLGLTRDMARDLGQHNIRVNGICPGCISTPMMDRSLERHTNPEQAKQKMAGSIPLRRLGTPREIANVALFLASDYATYVSGVSLPIDGGLLAQLPVQ
ncbi:MAG: SDR family NAD(P)-dependent oxidoreductase [Bryobacteraceae bacterium]